MEKNAMTKSNLQMKVLMLGYVSRGIWVHHGREAKQQAAGMAAG